MSKVNSFRKYVINYTKVPDDIPFSEINKIFDPCTCFYIEELLSSKRAWYVMYQYMVWFAMYAICDDNLVYRTVYIAKKDDPNFIPMQIPVLKLLVNMIFWYPFMTFDSADIIDNDKVILKPYAITANFVKDWTNAYVVDVDGASRVEKSHILDEMFYHMVSIAAAFDDVLGCGISVRTFYDINKQNPMLNEILHETIDANMQPHDIEAKIKANTAAIVDIICNTDNELITLMKCGLISPAQFGEVMVAIGFKSDLDGNTVPVPALSNILITGINNAADMFIDSVGGRLALIRSKLDMAGPGAHAKKLVNNCADITLRKDNVMCDSTAGVHYTIHDSDWLIRLNGRYYYDENGDMKCVDAKTDTHLIGKRLVFRSPETCTSPNNTVCRYCYGKLSNINDGRESIGAYAATITSEPLGQMILSTKHHNGTKSTEIELNEEHTRDFELRSTSICMINSDTNAAYIEISNIVKDETSDEDYARYSCMSFTVLDENKKPLYVVYDKNNAKLFLDDDTLMPLIKAKKVSERNSLLVDMDSLESECPLFTVEVASAQMTDPSKIIKKLTATKDKCGCRTLDQINERLGAEYINVGIRHDFVHNEVIVKSLLRKASDLYAYPDFGPNGDHTDYRILSVNDALYYNMSPLNSMRAANLKRQLIDPGLYSEKKRAPSHIDAMFAERLSDILPDKYTE